MGIIAYHQGCATAGCMGPPGPYYTFMNTPAFVLYIPVAFALIPSAIVAVVLWALTKRGKISWSKRAWFTTIAGTFLVFFVFFSSWTWVVY